MAAPGQTDRLDVAVSDEQEDVEVDTGRYAALLADALRAEGVVAPAEATLRFVTSDEMAELNTTHMGSSGPTDVLSFPIDGSEPLAAGEHRMVGDLVVCAVVARDQAADHAGSTDDEMALLVVHGALHLCGHDHADPDERATMWARERTLLDELWGPLVRDPWDA
jgi:probable rRNA maturation factor